MNAVENSRPILEIKELCKDFRIRSAKLMGRTRMLHALSDVSLTVYKGETLGVIGESGCGKSTLGRCIVGLHEATSGNILYQGKNVNDANKKMLCREIQMVFQDPYSSLDSRMTAGRAIEEPLIIHKLERRREKREAIVLDLMKKVGLDVQHFYRYPHEFSGGQRQRINIARALALNPRMIVCDEPVSALDVSIQAQVLNLLSDIQSEMGLTYIFISHDLSVIRYISDRIAIMYLGRIVELCDAAEIYKSPLHPYTQALLSSVPPASPFERKEFVALKGDITSPIGEQKGCALARRCQHCMQRCQEEIPELKAVSGRHQVACFLCE